MRLFTLFFIFINVLYANNRIDDAYGLFKSEDNSSALILPINIGKNYNFKWIGKCYRLDETICLADGKGSLTFIQKSDNYQTFPFKVSAHRGYIENNLSISTEYKCLDPQCNFKELKGIFKIVFKDTGKVIEEPYTFKGKLQLEKNDSIIKYAEGLVETQHFKYNGEIKDNNISGYGIFETKENNNLGFSVIQRGVWEKGHFKSGYLHTIYQDGALYNGASKNGIPDGFGTVTWRDGSKYQGYFKEGKKDGHGEFTFSDGSFYIGDYRDDKKNGYGELYIKSLDIYYHGNFKDGEFSGDGELYMEDKAIYIGKFKNGLPDGRGILIDENNTITKVVAYKGTFIKYFSLMERFLNNFPVTQLQAGWFSDAFNYVTQKVKQAYTWVKENKEHLINTVKGCVAGGIGGGVSGAAGGAIVGSFVGGIGAAPGAIVGGIAGGINGCINQGLKAWEISKKHNGQYTLNDAIHAVADEVSIENVVVGGGAAFIETFALIKNMEKAVSLTVAGSRAASKVYKVIKSSKSLKRLKEFYSKSENKFKRKICKFKLLKSFCKKNQQSKNFNINIVSWNLKNLSSKSQDRDWNTIKKFITLKAGYDVIALQEIMDKEALERIKGPFKAIISKPKGKRGKKEYYGFLINRLTVKKAKLINFRQYSKFRVPPSVLLVNNKVAIINVHIVFGGNNLVSKIKRIKEVKYLNSIIKELKKRYKNVKNIIIVGDFNLESEDILSAGLPLRIYIHDKTTISVKNRLKNSYDHFLSSTILGITKVEDDILKNRKIEYFNKKVSDHLPISGKFLFKNPKKRKK